MPGGHTGLSLSADDTGLSLSADDTEICQLDDLTYHDYLSPVSMNSVCPFIVLVVVHTSLSS